MSCAEAVIFLSTYQAMLSVNQQTIAGAQQSVAKPTLFSNPKTGSISCPKTGRAARGLLSLSWAARKLETCLIKHSRVSRRSIQTTKAGKPTLVADPILGSKFWTPKWGQAFIFSFRVPILGSKIWTPKWGQPLNAFFLLTNFCGWADAPSTRRRKRL